MNDLIFNNINFGIVISLFFFIFFTYLHKKTKSQIINPLILTMVSIILFLLILNIPFNYYNKGAKFIGYLLGPATVALALPLYKQIHLLKKHFWVILIGILVGSTTAVLSVLFLSKIFGLDRITIISLLPKSITTPIGMSISQSYNGEVPFTIIAIIITGNTGAIFAPYILKIFNIKNRIAKGIAIGTASHAVGTSKALEIGEIEGAMSSLAIGLAGIFTVFIIPIVIKIFNI
ncbi:putative murein hydrolase (TIGR00659 family) [Hypnocyclicus thermotrophus]|uniref:Murein hydrolase (TIGR00659 family) n=1 Tax=Hypnocyclicus thermotrophus TaxID=1627895 RepID=A0AA46I6D9_9FUSO|nr:LrgB family protein [Hypnocyclicus thermotrophus]TDT72355.1 putative murein hydrolase (TIGR00659 family) [Hypnocyclicus thermotrophus]